jgi:hypothetical protein
MNRLLIEGLTNVYRSLGAALRLFWPIAALFFLMALFGPVKVSGNFKTDPLGSIAILTVGLTLLIYLFLMLCQGAVGWHRKLLLNEYPVWVSLIPPWRALQYALPVVTFLLLMLVGLVLEMLVTQAYELQFMTKAYGELKITDNPTTEQLEALRHALIPMTIVNFVTFVLVIWPLLWLGRSWLLVFPHISVRNSQPVWGKIKRSVVPPPGLLGALLVVYFLPTFLGILYGIAVPLSVQLMPTVLITTNLIAAVLAMVCFLWGLSILSLAYRHATADKVSNEQTSGLAQA